MTVRLYYARGDELCAPRREESSQPWRAKVVFGSFVDGTIFALTEIILVVVRE